MVWYVLDPATSEAGAKWPRIGLVVVATTSLRDNKVQMIRPQIDIAIGVDELGINLN
jgi:hypothetical protein